MKFKLEHHQNILGILEAVNSRLFTDSQCYFGGGTLLALCYGEYRWSKDIDFMCPVGNGYRQLRTALAESGYSALFSDQSNINLPREYKADQYGVRFAVEMGGQLIKFEIVAEARLSLDAPAIYDWCPVPCLSFIDSYAEKLLANADRWLDKSIKARDLIDLCILRLQDKIPGRSLEKAEQAYPVVNPLTRAIESFQSNTNYRLQCYQALQIERPKHIIDGLDLLASDFGLSTTHRHAVEKS
jgi:predicted nucleotidyltransferase component of viral defense system